MKLRALSILCLMTSLLTGCLDHWYPNELSGNLNNGIYTSKPRNGRIPSSDTYSVMVPQHYNFYETPMLYATEHSGKDYTYVVFGPSATDETVYRVMVINKHNLPMDFIREKYFPAFIDHADKGADRQMDKIYQTDTTVNGHPALYQVYRELKPSVYAYISQRQPGTQKYTHAVYFADYGKYAVIFWFQYYSDSSINQINDDNYKTIIRQKHLPQVMFLRSFTIHEHQWGCCDKIL